MHSSDSLWHETASPSVEPLAEGVTLLRAFCRDEAPELLTAVSSVADTSPFRQMVVPSGHTMSVAMTNCGDLGWVTDRTGYRYDAIDPATGEPWPEMPRTFADLATAAAEAAGFSSFLPDACLVNRYAPGASERQNS